MAKQTAVDFLQEALSIHLTDEQKMQFEGLFQQAKAMEKEQICNAVNQHYVIPENYYKKTYGGSK